MQLGEGAAPTTMLARRGEINLKLREYRLRKATVTGPVQPRIEFAGEPVRDADGIAGGGIRLP